MDPLQPVPVPAHAVTLELTVANCWQTGSVEAPLYLAYVATNSTETVSFVSLQTAPGMEVLGLASRRAFSADYQYGVVVELRLGQLMTEGQVVAIALAQCGANTYYPAQPIDD